jgi:putative ABC transport system permease protein
MTFALRQMTRHPFFTFINVVGLSIGFATFLILWPYTQAELNSEKFIKDNRKIFRTLIDVRTVAGPETGSKLRGTMQPSFVTSKLFDDNLVEAYTRFITQDNFWPSYTPGLKAYLVASPAEKATSEAFKIENSICADQNFFDFFDLPFLLGNRNAALAKKEAIVLSERFAKALFGEQPALGKLMMVSGSPFEVTGVFENLPPNSHLNFDVAFSNVANLSHWNDLTPTLPMWCFHYCKSDDGDILLKTLNSNKDRMLGGIYKSEQVTLNFDVEPLTEIVFTNYFDNERYVTRSKFNIAMLAAVSLVVLLMAWMNYVNLTISRTRKRFTEMAARKVSGAVPVDLFLQFICQSALTNLLGILIAITIVQLVEIPFELFFNIYLVPFSEYGPGMMLFFLFVFATGIIACAIYPTWLATKYTARQLVSNKSSTSGLWLTSILTTFQYATALSLIVLILVSHTQLRFILSKELGINKENVVVFEAPVIGLEEDGVQKMIAFTEQLKSESNTSEFTLSGRVPGDYPYMAIVRKPGADRGVALDTYGGTDESFLAFYALKLLAGRNFQRDEKPNVVLLSRQAVKRLGFPSPEEAVGNLVEVNNYSEPFTTAEIIGVFEDYRVLPFLNSLNGSDASDKGQCFAYMNNLWKEDLPERVSVKLTLADLPGFIRKAERLFNDVFPGNVFHWYFLEDHIQRHYQQQEILRNQIFLFTFLAIGVACLGLLGMMANQVADKTKEIGIRKILGAHQLHISMALLHSTFKQALIAVTVGIPIAWMLSNEYLTRYSERIELQWWHFSIPVAVLFSIMLMTIVTLLRKAAKGNPVDALKYE